MVFICFILSFLLIEICIKIPFRGICKVGTYIATVFCKGVDCFASMFERSIVLIACSERESDMRARTAARAISWRRGGHLAVRRAARRHRWRRLPPNANVIVLPLNDSLCWSTLLIHDRLSEQTLPRCDTSRKHRMWDPGSAIFGLWRFRRRLMLLI